MKHTDHWGWMLAVDIFCGGMGGGMLFVAGTAGLLRGAFVFPWQALLAAPLMLALGSSFLILELGRPLQAWRVFLNPKAILTVGAWNMLVAMGAGLLYATFGLPWIPWAGVVPLRQIVALVCALVGLVVSVYPGVLLARHKSRPLWSGPGIAVLFLTSSLATALAAHLIFAWWFPLADVGVRGLLPWMLAALLAAQLLLWPLYVWIKRTGTTRREALAVQPWINGKRAAAFWGLLLGLGTLAPLLLVSLGTSRGVQVAAAGLVLFGGITLRWMVVAAGDFRTWLPGEEAYRARLPKGEEAFLKAWKTR